MNRERTDIIALHRLEMEASSLGKKCETFLSYRCRTYLTANCMIFAVPGPRKSRMNTNLRER